MVCIDACCSYCPCDMCGDGAGPGTDCGTAAPCCCGGPQPVNTVCAGPNAGLAACDHSVTGGGAATRCRWAGGAPSSPVPGRVAAAVARGTVAGGCAPNPTSGTGRVAPVMCPIWGADPKPPAPDTAGGGAAVAAADDDGVAGVGGGAAAAAEAGGCCEKIGGVKETPQLVKLPAEARDPDMSADGAGPEGAAEPTGGVVPPVTPCAGSDER